MNLLAKLRIFHTQVAPVVVIPLFVTVLSGVAYRLARDWFGFHRDEVHWLMSIHEGEWLGPSLEPFVVLLNASGLLWMLISGLGMVIQRWSKKVR